MTDLRAALGLIRSLLIYYTVPRRGRALRRLYAELIAPGELAFDIGAHVGNRTRTLLGLGAHVVALEPQPLFAGFLRRSFGGDDRFHLVQMAAGRCEGEAVLRVSRRHPTVSTLSAEWIEQVGATNGFRQVRWDREVPVPVTSLDALIRRFGRPAFCKIDVEGMEAEILAGLSQPVPLIAVEYVPAALDIARDCIGHLDRLGPYRFNLVVGETHRMVLAEWADVDGIHTVLTETAASGQSGDIYARLEA